MTRHKLSGFFMTKKQTQHLKRIQNSFVKEVGKKYLKGQQEHGGNLFEKPGMLDMAIEEVLDLAVYLYTLREQSEKERQG